MNMKEWVDELDDEGRFYWCYFIKIRSTSERRLSSYRSYLVLHQKRSGLITTARRDKRYLSLIMGCLRSGTHHGRRRHKDAALREIKEEIGIAESKENLEKIGVFKSVQEHHKLLRDCEFHHTFLCLLKSDIHQLKKQKEEVKDLRLIPLMRMAEETWGLANLSAYVPHGTSYYSTIIKSIQNRLNGS